MAERWMERWREFRQKVERAGGVTEDEQLLMFQVEQILARLDLAPNEFSVTTIVSSSTSKGMLDVTFGGQVAQLEPVKAREIAWSLMEAAAVAETEEYAMRFLREELGWGEKAARLLLQFRKYRSASQSSLVGNPNPS